LFCFDLLQEFFSIFRRDRLKSSKQHKESILLRACSSESFRGSGDLVPDASEFGMRDPGGSVREGDWPCPYDAGLAAPLRSLLQRLLDECVRYALSPG